MPYKYYLPDGSFYTVADHVSKEQMDDLARQKHPELFTPAESTMGGMFKKGLGTLSSQLQTLGEIPFKGVDEAARRALRRERDLTEEYGVGASLEGLGKKYDEEGMFPAAKELLKQSGLTLAENIPQLLSMAASGGLGSLAGAGKLAGVAASAYLPRVAGGIESQAATQQAEGKPIDVDLAKAAGYGLPLAALDVAAQTLPMGKAIAGKIFGPEVEKLLSIGAGEEAEQVAKDALVAKRGLLASAGRGVALNAAEQGVIQPMQVALSRMENGQDLTSPDALKDYGSAIYTAGLLSPMGALGGVSERSAARDRVSLVEAQRQEAAKQAAEAQAAAAKQAADAQAAAEATAEAQRQEAASRAAEEAPGIDKETGQTTFAPGLFGKEGKAEAPAVDQPSPQEPVPYSGQQDMFGAPTGGLFGKELIPLQLGFDPEAEAAQQAAGEAVDRRNGKIRGIDEERASRAAEVTGLGDRYPALIRGLQSLDPKQWVTPAYVARELGIDIPQAKEVMKDLEADGHITNPNKAGWYKVAKRAEQEAPTEEPKNAIRATSDTGGNVEPVSSEKPVARGSATSTGEPVLRGGAKKQKTSEVNDNGLVTAEPDTRKPAAGEESVPDTLTEQPAAGERSVPDTLAEKPAAGERSVPDTLTAEDRARILRSPLVEAQMAGLEQNAPNVTRQMEEDRNKRAAEARRTAIVNETQRLASEARQNEPTVSSKAVDALKRGRLGEALYHLMNEAGGDKKERLSDNAEPFRGHNESSPLRWLARALFNTVHVGNIPEREKIIAAETTRRTQELTKEVGRELTAKEKAELANAIRKHIMQDHNLSRVDVFDADGKLTAAGRIIYKSDKTGNPIKDKQGRMVRNFKPIAERMVKLPSNAKFNKESGDFEHLGGRDTRRVRTTKGEQIGLEEQIGEDGAKKLTPIFANVISELEERTKTNTAADIKNGAFAGADVIVEGEKMSATDKEVIARLNKEGKRAEYDPKQNKFYFTKEGLNDRTILHEMVHAATVKVLKNYENPETRKLLTEGQRRAAEELHTIYELAKRQLGEEHADALENIYEFAAHAATDKEFQQSLSEISPGKRGVIKPLEEKRSLWNMFTRAIAKMFGMDHLDSTNNTNALLRASLAIHDILSTPEKGLEVAPLAEKVAKQSEGVLQDDIPEDSGTGRATKAAKDIQEARESGSPKEELERIGEADLHFPDASTDMLQKGRSVLSKLTGKLKDSAQDAMSLFQKYQLYGKELPSLLPLEDHIMREGAKLKQREAGLNARIGGWMKELSDKAKYPPSVIKNFNDIAIRSTLDQIEVLNHPEERDAAGKVTRAARVREEGVLAARFKALPPELQKIYKDIRDSYDDMRNEYIKHITEHMKPTEVNKLRQEYEKAGLKVYLPLYRRGEYWVSFMDKGLQVKQAYASDEARKTAVASLKKEGITKVETYRNIQHMRESGPPPTGFLGEMLKALKDQGVTSPEILNSVYETYMDYLPAGALQQRFRTRARTLGMEGDIINAFANVAGTSTRLVNRMEFAKGYEDIMAKLHEEAEAAKNNNDIRAVMQSVIRQVDFARNPKTSPWASAAGYWSYLWFMAANASSAIVDATHLPMVVLPKLGGVYGWDNTSRELTRAAGKINFKDDLTPPKGYEKLYAYAGELGALIPHVSGELFDMKKSTVSDYTGTATKLRSGMDYMFRKADKLNRETTLIAAYELALKKSNGDVDVAHREAVNAVRDAYGSSLLGAKAPIFQHNVSRVMLTFKSFVLNRAFVLGRAFHQAFKSADKDTRSMARRQVLGMYAAAFAFSGVQGLPLVGYAEFLANQLMGDEDDPYDAEAEVRQAVGDWAFKGPVNHALNAEVADRTGWNDMMWKDDPRRLADVGFMDYAMERALGPIYGAVSQVQDAVKYFHQGNYERMFESALPIAARNVIKGVRYMSEGEATTATGKSISEVSPYSAVLQLSGFTPADLNEKRQMASSMSLEQSKIYSRRNALLSQAEGAYQLGNQDEIADVEERIAKFNEKNPDMPILAKHIAAGIKSSEKRKQSAVMGVSLNPRLQGRLLAEQGIDASGNAAE